MGQFQKSSAKSIIRHQSGTYYLSAKVGGKKVRKSLKTKDLGAARMRRDDELAALQRAAGRPGLETLGDAVSIVVERMTGKPGLKAATVTYYKELGKVLRETLPVKMKAAEWSPDDARKWWSDVAGSRAGSQANNLLQAVRKVGRLLVDEGVTSRNPTNGLSTVRVKATAVEVLPTQEDLAKVVEEMRGQPFRHSEESADMVEFFAWSGMRPAELRALQWSDVGEDRIRVTGGEEGTKNHEARWVPISGPLRKVIDRRRGDLKPEECKGPVFHIENPRGSFKNALERLGMPTMRVYDLRHVFATHAIESGVDVPTVAKWLGHKDGGALAMRTYGHIRDDHSLAAIKKLG